MNKKKMILTSLASVAILGAGFVTSQPTVVRAEEAPVASQSKAEKDYDAAVKKSEAAKKHYEEAKKKAEDAQKKYDEDQKKTEDKAEAVKKADEELQKANLEVQKAYVEYQKAQREHNESRGRKKADAKKKLVAALSHIEEVESKQIEAKANFNKEQAKVIPKETELATTKQKAEEAKKRSRSS